MSIIISVIGAVLFCDSTKEGMVSYEDTFNVKKKKKKHCQKVKQLIIVTGRRSNKSNR